MAASQRTVLHVDMDAFFVAVELRRRPDLAGRPVVVGGSGPRGVVAAASYEARRYGVRSAMPSSRARALCPDAVFLQGDHGHYAEISRELHRRFLDVTPLVEPIALDEAFLDVTGSRRLFGDGETIARGLRRRIREELELNCSVGVAASKLVAKLASEAAKPRAGPGGVVPGRGVVVVAPGGEEAFLHPLPVQALWGVGPATFDRLDRLGIRTIGDLATTPRPTLVAVLGEATGTHLHRLARAIDERPVEPHREVKSISHEETFARDVSDREELEVVVVRQADAVAARLRRGRSRARTITLKVRFGDFRTITRATTLPVAAQSGPPIVRACRELLGHVDVGQGVRLVGVAASGIVPAGPVQLVLEDDGGLGSDTAWDPASEAVDHIRERFGEASIGPARTVGPEGPRPVRPGQQAWGPGASDAL